MTAIKELDTLMKSMRPELVKGEFVFCTVSEDKFSKLNVDSLMIFKEKEGIAMVLEKQFADNNNITYDGVWSMITLTVHSSLDAVGFLAKITTKLAENGIGLNAISAYYHDHLFVRPDVVDKVLSLLKGLSE